MSKSVAAATVSVIIPTFNRAGMIGRCLDSVRAQTFRDLEIVVVDDGSTDDTRAVVGRYQGVRYVWQENQERSAARNRGLAASRGRFVAFLDSDDEWLPEKLARQVAYLERYPAAGMVHAACQRKCGEEVRTFFPAESHEPRPLFWDILRRRCLIAMPTPLIRRDALDAVGGFWTALNCAEDLELWLRIAYRYPIGCIGEPLAVYHVHEGSGGRLSEREAYRKIVTRAREYVAPAERPALRAAAADLFAYGAITRRGENRRAETLKMLLTGLRTCGPALMARPRAASLLARCLLPLPLRWSLH